MCRVCTEGDVGGEATANMIRAARVGMKWLKNHATAAEAVEAAIRVLEDKEITNAGFGSNLNMDGVVECDATIVDHLGRSGACGAVPGKLAPFVCIMYDDDADL